MLVYNFNMEMFISMALITRFHFVAKKIITENIQSSLNLFEEVDILEEEKKDLAIREVKLESDKKKIPENEENGIERRFKKFGLKIN